MDDTERAHLKDMLDYATRVALHTRIGQIDHIDRVSIAGEAVFELWRRYAPDIPRGLVPIVVRRRLIDFLRTEMGRKYEFRPVSTEDTYRELTEAPRDILADHNVKVMIEWALSRLPDSRRMSNARRIRQLDTYREMLEMLADGYSYVEIARVQGVTQAAITHRLYKLRELIQRDPDAGLIDRPVTDTDGAGSNSE